jgi:hypothetical protein
MAQHLLQAPYVDSVAHAVDGKTVPERVRVDVLAYQLRILV